MNMKITLTWTNGQYILNNCYHDCVFTYSFDDLNGLIKYFVEAYAPEKMPKDGIYTKGIITKDRLLFSIVANDTWMVTDYDCEKIIDNSDVDFPNLTLLVKLNINDNLYALSINISYHDAKDNGIQYITKDMYNNLLANKYLGPHIKLTIK